VQKKLPFLGGGSKFLKYFRSFLNVFAGNCALVKADHELEYAYKKYQIF
jgi:hypothetical protein